MSLSELSASIVKAGWKYGMAAMAACVLATATPAAARDVLVLGIDISDTVTFDPARSQHTTPTITLHAVYDTLVTVRPGAYDEFVPLLAESFEPIENGFRFHLRKDAKFVSGQPVTAEDVKFSLERAIGVGDQPSIMATNIAAIAAVDAHTIDVTAKNPAQDLLPVLASPSFGIYEKAVVVANGGVSGAEAKDKDSATTWFNGTSAGSGPYQLTGWERNGSIVLTRNPNYWGEKPAYERVIFRHMGEGASQLLALRRGDVDAAFNLSPEQIDALAGEEQLEITSVPSLDFVYMTLTAGEKSSSVLSNQKVRQAIARAIDYDGLINNLMGGAATRPATFIPVGIGGSTAEFAKEHGYSHDPEAAKALLAEAGVANPAFEASYATGAIYGTTTQIVMQKVQSDLKQVGIDMKLVPTDPVNLRTRFVAGELESTIASWTPPSMDVALTWALPAVERLAKRIDWTPAPAIKDMVLAAANAGDVEARLELYRDFQRRLVEAGNFIVLFQPDIRVVKNKRVGDLNLTAAGWQLELGAIKPAE